MKNKYAMSLGKKVPYGTYYAGILGKPLGKSIEKPLDWYAVDIISQRVPHFIKLVQNQIRNDPFFGIYDIIDARNIEKNTRVYLYMEPNQQVRDLLMSEKFGAASIKKEIGGTEALPTPPIGKGVADQYTSWFTNKGIGKNRGLLRKVITQPKEVGWSQLVKVVDQIENENILMAEYMNVIITSLDVVDSDGNSEWKFELNIGYLYGLISEEGYRIAAETRSLTTGSIDILGKPMQITNYTAGFKNLEDLENKENFPEIINHAKIASYLDTIKTEADRLLQEATSGKSLPQKTVVNPPDDTWKGEKKAMEGEGEEGAKNIPVDDGGYGADIPFQETETPEEASPETVPQEDVAEETKNYLKDYKIVFERQGNVRLVLELVINNEVIVHQIEMWGETLSKLLTNDGISFILDCIDDTLKTKYRGQAPFINLAARKMREGILEQSENTPFANVNNGRFYFDVFNIDTDALIEARTKNPDGFWQYYESVKQGRESEQNG